LSHDRRKPIRYNTGMLCKEKSAIGMVWVFRWSEEVKGQRRQHKEVQEQQASADWVAHAAPITSYIADLERRECEGRTIATSSHHPQDNLGTLRRSGFRRPAESTQEGRPDGTADEISREIESGGGSGSSSNSSAGSTGEPSQLTISSITITHQAPNLNVGATQQMKATGTYSNGSTSDMTSAAAWSSSNTAVVTVSADRSFDHHGFRPRHYYCQNFQCLGHRICDGAKISRIDSSGTGKPVASSRYDPAICRYGNI